VRMGLRYGPGAMEKRKILSLPGIEPLAIAILTQLSRLWREL
jgi:hypothetical protein